MVKYPFSCEDCEVKWTREGSMDKPKKRSKCPSCGKMRSRSFESVPIHFKGMDFHTNQARAERFHKYGFDKDSARKFYNDSIKNSKERMKSGDEHYKKMVIPEDKATEQGMVSRTSGERSEKKKESAKSLDKVSNNLSKKDS
jgi:predicted nucleic acid-binding Zn ribbon protein